MVPFKQFMESALYDPQRGFYSNRIPTQDFYTAPELTPVFAGVLAREVAARLDELAKAGVPGPYAVVEMGSGSGLLARQVITALRKEFPRWAHVRYALVERIGPLLLDSVMSLADLTDKVVGSSALEDVLPCAGVFLSNELVDAFPVHLLEKKDGKVYEVLVDEAGRTSLGALSDAALAPYAAQARKRLADGERHAVNLEALSWLRLVASKLQAGYLLTVDYGSRSPYPNPPRAFQQHATDHDVTLAPGQRDLTAGVDFDMLITEGKKLDLELESYNSLTRFLIDRKVEDFLPAGDGSPAGYAERNRFKTLLHPDGMGERFKVLIQSKGMAQ